MNAFTSFLKKIAVIKGTVSVISSDPSCKDDNARFTIVPLKNLYGQSCGRYCRFLKFKWFISEKSYMFCLQ